MARTPTPTGPSPTSKGCRRPSRTSPSAARNCCRTSPSVTRLRVRDRPIHFISRAPFKAFTEKMLTDPSKIVAAQVELWQEYMKLWQATAQRVAGQKIEPVIEPAKGDKRFNDPAWKEEPVFDVIKQSYLLTSRWAQRTLEGVEGVDDKTAKKVEFYTKQFIDALSPSNFLRPTRGREGDRRTQGREPGEGPAEPADRPRARRRASSPSARPTWRRSRSARTSPPRPARSSSRTS